MTNENEYMHWEKRRYPRMRTSLAAPLRLTAATQIWTLIWVQTRGRSHTPTHTHTTHTRPTMTGPNITDTTSPNMTTPHTITTIITPLYSRHQYLKCSQSLRWPRRCSCHPQWILTYVYFVYIFFWKKLHCFLAHFWMCIHRWAWTTSLTRYRAEQA